MLFLKISRIIYCWLTNRSSIIAQICFKMVNNWTNQSQLRQVYTYLWHFEWIFLEMSFSSFSSSKMNTSLEFHCETAISGLILPTVLYVLCVKNRLYVDLQIYWISYIYHFELLRNRYWIEKVYRVTTEEKPFHGFCFSRF